MARLKAKKKAEPKGVGFCVYIGPTIVGQMQNGTVYRGEKPDVLKRPDVAAAIEKRPHIASLSVPGDTLAVDRIKVNTPGNLLYVNYRRLASGEN